jgi:hypothetical protein
MQLLDTIDLELTNIRKELYKSLEYSEVEDVMDCIHEAIDKIEEIQDLLLEIEDE